MLFKTEWLWELRTWSHKMNLLDILSTSPHYLSRKWIEATKRIQILILEFKGLSGSRRYFSSYLWVWNHAISVNINFFKHVGFSHVLTRIAYSKQLHIKHKKCSRGNFISHGEFPISVLMRNNEFTELTDAHVAQTQVPTGDYLSFTKNELEFTEKKKDLGNVIMVDMAV